MVERKPVKPKVIDMKRSGKSRVFQIEPEPPPAEDLSFSRGERMIIYVLGFCLACAMGCSGGYVIALLAWAIAHGHVIARRAG